MIFTKKTATITTFALMLVQNSMALAVKNDLEVVPEIDLTVAIDPPKYSASYISVFARDNDPEPAFELVDDDASDVRSKIVSFKRRGLTGCESEHTGTSL